MKKNFYILLIFITVSFLIILNNSNFLVSSFSSLAQNLSSGPKQILTSFKAGFATDTKEMQQLKDENKKLQERLVDYQKIKSDNDALRSQFADSTVSSQKLVPAKIVGFMGKKNTPQILILDQGKNSNIKRGMGVIYGKYLVGKIKQVLDNFSQVETVFSPEFSTLASTTTNNSSGVIKGREDFMLLDKVIATDKIDKKELAVTKGEFDGNFGIPQGIIIGEIVSVSTNKSSPFQIAQVDSFIDYPKLQTVFITAL